MEEIDTVNIRNALDDARESLRQTVAEVNLRVTRVSAQLVSEYLVERYLPAGMCISGVLGYAAGNRDASTNTGSSGGLAGVATLILGGLLGAVLTEASRRDQNRAKKAR
jgi:hypothetical protein